MKTNKIRQELISLGIIDDKKVINFYPRVRDRDDVSVLKCEHSGVIFLSGTDHIEESYYNDRQFLYVTLHRMHVYLIPTSIIGLVDKLYPPGGSR